MDCEKIRAMMSAHADDRLSAYEKKAFAKHLKNCEACRSEYEKYAAFVDDTRSLAEYGLPENYHDHLMEKIRALPVKTPFVWDFKHMDFKKYTAVAAGLVVTLSVMTTAGTLLNLMSPSTAVPQDLYSSGVGPSAAGAVNRSVEMNRAAPVAALTIEMAGDESVTVEADAKEAQPQAARAVGADISAVSAAGALSDVLPVPVILAEKTLCSSYITVVCDDLSMAVDVINGLPGYNTGSNVRFYEAGDDTYGRADITRRTDDYTYDFVLNVLRGLGTVESETESRSNLASEYSELEIYIKNAQSELDRLNILLSQSDSLDSVIYIQNRISDVTWRLDADKGRRNEIDGLTKSYYIHINLYTETPSIPVVKLKFSERLVNGFTDSASFSLRFLQWAAVAVSALFVPVAALAVLVAAGFFIHALFRRVKK